MPGPVHVLFCVGLLSCVYVSGLVFGSTSHSLIQRSISRVFVRFTAVLFPSIQGMYWIKSASGFIPSYSLVLALSHGVGRECVYVCVCVRGGF
jgi:hypothetical protein